MARVGIREVAALAGVSIATVSYVLNRSRAVGAETEARVLAAAEELGYRPSVTARSLKTRRSYLIGYSWPAMPARNGSPILDRFIHSMGSAAYRAGYHLLAFPAPPHEDEIELYRELVATNRVSGIVLSSTNLNDPRVAYLSSTRMPFVAFGRADAEVAYPWVDVDGRAGVRRAVEHLVEEGYERIGMLAWPEGSQSGEDRYRGYLEGLAATGREPRAEWQARVEHDADQAAAAMGEMLALREPPDAVVCVSDLVALGALNAIRNAGLRPGPDVGVVGFDDMPLAPHLSPPLSSVHQPIDLIGERVIALLTSAIERRPFPDGRAQILLEPRVIIRDSSRRR